MPTCDFCEADFYPSSAAWNQSVRASVCGDCYATQLRLLLGAGETGERKPPRRAQPPHATADASAGIDAPAARRDLAA